MEEKPNSAAEDLWRQIFARLAESDFATIVDPEYDAAEDTARLREGLTNAGWTEEHINSRLAVHLTETAVPAESGPRVAPYAELMLNRLCDDVEAALSRLGIQASHLIARGVEPRAGPSAGLTNVIMTDQGIVTVSAFLFRFCGLIARAFTRTLLLNPWAWEASDYSEEYAEKLIYSNPEIVNYWVMIYISFACTGTHVMVPFKPAAPREILLFEQVARAMELFIIGHEYGHHCKSHGRDILSDRKSEEYEADQIALKVCYEIESRPFIMENPYLSSGAGGAIILIALELLRKCESAISGINIETSATHPALDERLKRFESVSIVKSTEYMALKGFRVASIRIMEAVSSIVDSAIANIPDDVKIKMHDIFNAAREK